MTKDKINLLEKAMEVRTRDDKSEFTCFTDTAPQELKDVFLSHFEVRDLDYQIFSDAIDAITNAYADCDNDLADLRQTLENQYTEHASIYTTDRLAYLSLNNEDEISDTFKEYGCDSISTACAYWYDNQVNNAIQLILNDYLNLN